MKPAQPPPPNSPRTFANPLLARAELGVPVIPSHHVRFQSDAEGGAADENDKHAEAKESKPPPPPSPIIKRSSAVAPAPPPPTSPRPPPPNNKPPTPASTGAARFAPPPTFLFERVEEEDEKSGSQYSNAHESSHPIEESKANVDTEAEGHTETSHHNYNTVEEMWEALDEATKKYFQFFQVFNHFLQFTLPEVPIATPCQCIS